MFLKLTEVSSSSSFKYVTKEYLMEFIKENKCKVVKHSSDSIKIIMSDHAYNLYDSDYCYDQYVFATEDKKIRINFDLVKGYKKLKTYPELDGFKQISGEKIGTRKDRTWRFIFNVVKQDKVTVTNIYSVAGYRGSTDLDHVLESPEEIDTVLDYVSQRS